ncbi:MAG: AIPR family protein, partial [Synergistaceae bacterium]|nr:AIPR family protein [Synergistaceae bacterium]
MSANSQEYEYIVSKIASLRESYPFLRNKTDAYVFSALCVKSNFYKNPAIPLNDSDLEEIIVDSISDGGVDILLTDPSSESSDLIIGQSKFYRTIKFDDVINALYKMADFYKDMIKGQTAYVNGEVQRRFLTLNSDVGEESKIIFVFYTSAPRGKISVERLQERFKERFSENSNIELSVLFASDIIDEIKESESRRPTVESGRIVIDRAGNILEYGKNEEAIIVNVSALSVKQLYAQHGTSLLAKNLRYYIKTPAGSKIDRAIKNTINNDPDSFWMKNNGITIICDLFEADGKEVHLSNFSIINGGQTTYLLYRSKSIQEGNDFYFPCKIVRVSGNSEDEKNLYSLGIAQAVNSQKAIKDIDLKANAPEQVRFAQVMRQTGIFYQTKRGEVVPKEYSEPYMNADLATIGKLCLCAILQLPCTSRNTPSIMYKKTGYYDTIFNGDQLQIAKICEELLYIDHYFRNRFIKDFDKENKSISGAEDIVSFAHNARTICIAFISLASRYKQGNITDDDISKLAYLQPEAIFKIFRNMNGVKYIFPKSLFQRKDEYDNVLKKLFNLIISSGIAMYTAAKTYDPSVNATNFLKMD